MCKFKNGSLEKIFAFPFVGALVSGDEARTGFWIPSSAGLCAPVEYEAPVKQTTFLPFSFLHK